MIFWIILFEALLLLNFISLCDGSFHIVYFAYLNPKRDWGWLITKQLEHLCETSALSAAHLHISFTTSSSNTSSLESNNRLQQGQDLIDTIIRRCKTMHDVKPLSYSVQASGGNTFEYPGINLVWSIAQSIPKEERNQSVVLYFHSKGMVYHNNKNERIDVDLFKAVIEPWKIVLQHFTSDSTLNKVGYAMSHYGYAWHNFWYARASYIAQLPAPMVVTDRYYYERWLGGHNSSKGMCADSWSMCAGAKYGKGLSFAWYNINRCKTWQPLHVDNKSKKDSNKKDYLVREIGVDCYDVISVRYRADEKFFPQMAPINGLLAHRR